jgi:D-3-phosphoglycerate dehydrogenase
MGANVAICDSKKVKDTPGIKVFKTIEGLIQWSDTIALCANYDAKVGQIIHLKHLEAMKDKYFINTARAELTDEIALVKMAQKGHFKGLAIDVITEEQSSQKHLGALIKAAKQFNIVITPHIGGATYTSMCRTEEFIAEKLLKQIDGK